MEYAVRKSCRHSFLFLHFELFKTIFWGEFLVLLVLGGVSLMEKLALENQGNRTIKQILLAHRKTSYCIAQIETFGSSTVNWCVSSV